MDRGFTMIELVLVVVIIATVALIAVPRLSAAQTGTRINAAESRLRSEFAAVATLSRSTGRTHAIRFVSASDEVRIYAGRTANEDNLIRTVSLAERPYAVAIDSASISDGRTVVVVDPYGMYSANASVQITSGSVRRIVSLEGPTAGEPIESVKDATRSDGLIGGLLNGLLGGL